MFQISRGLKEIENMKTNNGVEEEEVEKPPPTLICPPILSHPLKKMAETEKMFSSVKNVKCVVKLPRICTSVKFKAAYEAALERRKTLPPPEIIPERPVVAEPVVAEPVAVEPVVAEPVVVVAESKSKSVVAVAESKSKPVMVMESKSVVVAASKPEEAVPPPPPQVEVEIEVKQKQQRPPTHQAHGKRKRRYSSGTSSGSEDDGQPRSAKVRIFSNTIKACCSLLYENCDRYEEYRTNPNTRLNSDVIGQCKLVMMNLMDVHRDDCPECDLVLKTNKIRRFRGSRKYTETAAERRTKEKIVYQNLMRERLLELEFALREKMEELDRVTEKLNRKINMLRDKDRCDPEDLKKMLSGVQEPNFEKDNKYFIQGGYRIIDIRNLRIALEEAQKCGHGKLILVELDPEKVQKDLATQLAFICPQCCAETVFPSSSFSVESPTNYSLNKCLLPLLGPQAYYRLAEFVQKSDSSRQVKLKSTNLPGSKFVLKLDNSLYDIEAMAEEAAEAAAGPFFDEDEANFITKELLYDFLETEMRIEDKELEINYDENNENELLIRKPMLKFRTDLIAPVQKQPQKLLPQAAQRFAQQKSQGGFSRFTEPPPPPPPHRQTNSSHQQPMPPPSPRIPTTMAAKLPQLPTQPVPKKPLHPAKTDMPPVRRIKVCQELPAGSSIISVPVGTKIVSSNVCHSTTERTGLSPGVYKVFETDKPEKILIVKSMQSIGPPVANIVTLPMNTTSTSTSMISLPTAPLIPVPAPPKIATTTTTTMSNGNMPIITSIGTLVPSNKRRPPKSNINKEFVLERSVVRFDSNGRQIPTMTTTTASSGGVINVSSMNELKPVRKTPPILAHSRNQQQQQARPPPPLTPLQSSSMLIPIQPSPPENDRDIIEIIEDDDDNEQNEVDEAVDPLADPLATATTTMNDFMDSYNNDIFEDVYEIESSDNDDPNDDDWTYGSRRKRKKSNQGNEGNRRKRTV